jgi:hypothetical protein
MDRERDSGPISWEWKTFHNYCYEDLKAYMVFLYSKAVRRYFW